MLEQLFRTNEAAQSTVYGVLMATLASFFLSFLLVLTYRLTSNEIVERREFIQGMALVSVVATMIMQAIGDSLARGLGMLGALSIIRFRTSLTSPRNMAFMFASLAAGIGCGVFGFTIAFIGTTAFCLVAFALNFEFRGERTTVRGELRVTLAAEEASEGDVRQLMGRYVTRLRLSDRRYKLPAAKPVSTSAAEGSAVGASAVETSATVANTNGNTEHSTHLTVAGNGHPHPVENRASEQAAIVGTAATRDGQLVNSAARRAQIVSSPGSVTAGVPASPPATLSPPTTPAKDEDSGVEEIITYHFRMRRGASELELLRAVDAHRGVLDHRLRFTQSLENL